MTALFKDVIRDIRKSKGRFFSIVAIIALGVAFFTGLKLAPESMRFTADKYYDEFDLMDIRVVSTLGLTDEDLEEIEKIEGVESALGTKDMDIITNYDNKEMVMKIHSYNKDDNINRYKLIEGRMPEKEDECLVEQTLNDAMDIKIGSTLDFESGIEDKNLEDDLKNTKYKVVGKVQTPYYLSYEKGNSNIGNGKVRSFIVIPRENFKSEIYTDIYLTVEGAKEINSYNDEYFDLIDPVVEELKVLKSTRESLRYDEIIGEAEEELEEAREKYEEEKDKIELELEEAEEDILKGKEELQLNEERLEEEEENLEQMLEDGEMALDDGDYALSKGIREYEYALEDYEEMKISAQSKIKEGEAKIKEMEASLEELKLAKTEIELSLEVEMPEEEKKALEGKKAEIEENSKKLVGGISQAKSEIENGKRELTIGKEKLEEARLEIEQSRANLDQERENLVAGKDEGKKALREGRRALEEAREELKDGEIKYEEGREKAEKELKDAKKELDDAEREIRKIEKGKWHILDRDKHYSYVDYGGAADRMDALARVFPLFFALVAALVCLTSMTRMVDEQRGNIGTLKALGYSNIQISFKYIFYGLVASVLGSIIGVAIGYSLFPVVIFNAYGLMYVLPEISLVFNTQLAIIVTLVAVVLTTGATYLAAINELRETPAILMRPKAPKVGKRIFLEQIPALWKRFNFSQKVTLRNIFRYKRRFFMTVFGIAGCTALVIAGFGIRDSIKTIIDRQYGVIFNYNMSVGLEEDGIRHLDQHEYIVDYAALMNEAGTVENEKKEKEIRIMVPENIKELEKFIVLQTRDNEEKIDIEKDGVVITDQISTDFNLKVGDKIDLKNSEKDVAEVTVTGITENYAFNYVYMSKEYYEKIYPEEFKVNQAIGDMKDTSDETEEKLSLDLMNEDEIIEISFNTVAKADLEDVIGSLDSIVWVMIISAGALAFVVLYNLTNVNISERIREIATIKVLGFYDGEVAAYIYRENTILTLIGIFVGLFMGKYLHRYIMTTVEMENIMFGLKLNLRSIVLSIIITIVFSILVNFVMFFKLKNIEMVESLKSID